MSTATVLGPGEGTKFWIVGDHLDFKITRKETGALRYSLLQLGYMSSLAYVVALIVYQSSRLAGWQ